MQKQYLCSLTKRLDNMTIKIGNKINTFYEKYNQFRKPFILNNSVFLDKLLKI